MNVGALGAAALAGDDSTVHGARCTSPSLPAWVDSVADGSIHLPL